MKKTEIAILGAVVLIAGGTLAASYAAIRDAQMPATACTLEAKICPDGTAVGRTGPDCSFAPCPATASSTPGTAGGDVPASSTGPAPQGSGGAGSVAPYQSGISGAVLLGPTCPVMREPPDPDCADKPYATTVVVSRQGSQAIFATAKSDENGVFKIPLPPGDYTVSAEGGDPLPRCASAAVSVEPGGYAAANISCDTGIR